MRSWHSWPISSTHALRHAGASRGRIAAQIAAFAVPAATVLLLFGGGAQTSLTCSGADVKPTIVGLFKRQLKLTPYARFIDVAKADVKVEGVFDVAAGAGTQACVAFATYEAKLNDAGQHVEGSDRLRYNLIYELSGEKQVFYTVKLTPEGRRALRVDRISG